MFQIVSCAAVIAAMSSPLAKPRALTVPGDLIDVIADGGELAAYLGILIRRTRIQGKAHDEATDK